MPKNALTQRLDVLNQHYTHFLEDEHKQVCIWYTAREELRMIEAFYRLEGSTQANFPDLFLGFTSPFLHPEEYTNTLRQEFQKMLDQGATQLAEQNIQLPFRLPPRIDRPTLLLQYFQQFCDALTYIEGNIVLWLLPQRTVDFSLWEKWLIDVVDHGLPPRVSFLLTPDPKTPLSELEERHSSVVYRKVLELDMEGAIRQMAASGNPKDPGVQFRQLMVDMNLAAQKGRIQYAAAQGKKALAIAEQQVGWEHLEVAICLSIAGFQPASADQEARNYYEKARRRAARALDQEHVAGLEVYTQAYFALAAHHIKQQSYDEAIPLYEEIARRCADQPSYAFQQLEAYRMTGYCYRRERQLSASWDAYWRALQTADLLDAQTRPYTTLPYIGEGLLDVMLPTNNQRHERELRRKLVEYVGPDWEEKIKQHKIPLAT